MRDLTVLGICLALASVFCLLPPPSQTPASHPGPTPSLPEGSQPYQGLFSLVWAAPVLSWGGYGSEARLFALSLDALQDDLRVKAVQHGDSLSWELFQSLPDPERTTLERLVARTELSLELPLVHVCHSEPGAWHPPRYNTAKCPGIPSFPPASLGKSSVPADYQAAHWPPVVLNIGRTMFETDRLPKGWSERCEQMDFVWVPTEFHREVFSKGGVPLPKLVVVPESVDTDFFSKEQVLAQPSDSRFLFPKPLSGEGSFHFLSIFKWEERKGPEILLSAYLKEFARASEKTAPERVVLSILTSAYHSSDDFDTLVGRIQNQVLEETNMTASQLPEVRLLPSGVPQVQLPSVFAGADCFVLPSRGEGWGRPHVEAMSMGLPVIATNFSGPTEYLNELNGYPLRIDGMDEVPSGAFRGHLWARPSISHLRELLRHVYEHPEEARERGARARADMERLYNPQVVAKGIVEELRREIGIKFQQLELLRSEQVKSADAGVNVEDSPKAIL